MSWPYCEPKSRMRTRSFSGNSVIVTRWLRDSQAGKRCSGTSAKLLFCSQLGRAVGGCFDRIDQGRAKARAFQSVQPSNGGASWTGDLIFQSGRMLAGLQEHLGGAEHG